MEFFLEMNGQKNEDIHGGKTCCELDFLCNYETRYDELLRKGKELVNEMKAGSFGYDELRRIANRLEAY